MSIDRGVTQQEMTDRWQLRSPSIYPPVSFLAWTLGANKPVSNEVINWSISQSCFGSEYSESMKELQTEQNSMLVFRQGKRKGM